MKNYVRENLAKIMEKKGYKEIVDPIRGYWFENQTILSYI